LKLRTLFGILSIVMWLLAILTIVLPIASIVVGGIGVTPSQSSSSSTSGQIPTSYQVSNHGFLPINGVYLDVEALYPNGTQLYSITAGPVNITPGSTVQINIATSSLPVFSSNSSSLLAGQSSVVLQATATANLGGLIPISATANFRISLNSSSPSS
jgi:hypothetical protein